jgi:hypothetical protein
MFSISVFAVGSAINNGSDGDVTTPQSPSVTDTADHGGHHEPAGAPPMAGK